MNRLFLATMLGLGATTDLIAAPPEKQTISIPGQGWKISFEAPPFQHQKESKQDGDPQFKASAGRLNLSLFVESPQQASSGHKDCCEFHWKLTRRNGMIDPESVKVSHTDTLYRVQYLVEAGSDKQLNVNYYFVFAGKWIDLHISIIAPTDEDAALIKRFDETLTYGREVN